VTARTALDDPANELHLSVVSVWELAIKTGNKKLTLADPMDKFVGKWTVVYQLALLTIDTAHALAVVGLPDHHRDPFDRMLIAQALVEGLTLATADAKFAPYSVPILW
jgi:PIN domain nuclease of toxin-antitoxin system